MGGITSSLTSSFNKYKQVTPVSDKKNITKSKKNTNNSIFDCSQASRSHFHFLQRLTITYSCNNNSHSYYQNLRNQKINLYNQNQNKEEQNIFASKQNKNWKCEQILQQPIQQSIVWIANHTFNKDQKFYIKQTSKYQLMNNRRIQSVHLQLDLFKKAQFHYGGQFVNKLLFAFQDYQYLYMVSQYIPGYTLKKVLKNHFFTQQQTKYVVAALIQLTEFINSQGYALSQLTPEHILITKDQGKLKLLQIFNPISIDNYYPYEMITDACIYSAPQVLARDQILAQSDYYTIGMIMYEMMTQKSCISFQNQNQFSQPKKCFQRNELLTYEIDIKKYNLPEGWNPEAADFLLKLLVKNPQYRLGRYGSFQLKSHPWLRNYNWETLNNRNGVNLNQKYFSKSNQSQRYIEKVLKFRTKKQFFSSKNAQILVKYQQASNKNISSNIQNNIANFVKKSEQKSYVNPIQKTTKFIKLFDKYKFTIKEENNKSQQDYKQQNNFKDTSKKSKSKNDHVSISQKYRDSNLSNNSQESQQQQQFSSQAQKFILKQGLNDIEANNFKNTRKSFLIKQNENILDLSEISQKKDKNSNKSSKKLNRKHFKYDKEQNLQEKQQKKIKQQIQIISEDND